MRTEFNRHLNDFNCDFTLEFDVKNPGIPEGIPEDFLEYEYYTGNFINTYAEALFAELKKKKYKWVEDWSFAGRSNGWFVLLGRGNQRKISTPSVIFVDKLVKKYLDDFGKRYLEYFEEFKKQEPNERI